MSHDNWVKPSMNPYMKEFWSITKRYKTLYGGRASSKTWDAALQAVRLSSNMTVKFMCVRQFQANIRESVYTILVDTIARCNLTDEYHITDRQITHKKTGSSFVFFGLWRNIDEVKSTEGIDILWIEEAHNLTKEQWEVLDPTIRKQGSQIWVIFNPSNRLAFTWKRFIENPMENSVSLKVNYTENPFISDTMLAVIAAAKKENYEDYEHIYLGFPNESSETALFTYKDLDRARNRRVKPEGAIVLGLDVARYGDDSSVITKKHGLKVFPLLQRTKLGGDEVANWGMACYNNMSADAIVVDTIGTGGTVYDLLVRQGVFAIDGNNAMQATDPDRYKNKRAESYWKLSQSIKKGLIELPDDDDLAEELLAIEYFFDTAGRIQILDKKKIKEVLGRSPDKADSVALTFFTDVFANQSKSDNYVGEVVAPNLY